MNKIKYLVVLVLVLSVLWGCGSVDNGTNEEDRSIESSSHSLHNLTEENSEYGNYEEMLGSNTGNTSSNNNKNELIQSSANVSSSLAELSFTSIHGPFALTDDGRLYEISLLDTEGKLAYNLVDENIYSLTTQDYFISKGIYYPFYNKDNGEYVTVNIGRLAYEEALFQKIKPDFIKAYKILGNNMLLDTSNNLFRVTNMYDKIPNENNLELVTENVIDAIGFNTEIAGESYYTVVLKDDKQLVIYDENNNMVVVDNNVSQFQADIPSMNTSKIRIIYSKDDNSVYEYYYNYNDNIYLSTLISEVKFKSFSNYSGYLFFTDIYSNFYIKEPNQSLHEINIDYLSSSINTNDSYSIEIKEISVFVKKKALTEVLSDEPISIKESCDFHILILNSDGTISYATSCN